MLAIFPASSIVENLSDRPLNERAVVLESPRMFLTIAKKVDFPQLAAPLRRSPFLNLHDL